MREAGEAGREALRQVAHADLLAVAVPVHLEQHTRAPVRQHVRVLADHLQQVSSTNILCKSPYAMWVA